MAIKSLLTPVRIFVSLLAAERVFVTNIYAQADVRIVTQKQDTINSNNFPFLFNASVPFENVWNVTWISDSPVFQLIFHGSCNITFVYIRHSNPLRVLSVTMCGK